MNRVLLILALLVTSADAKPVRIGTYRPTFRIGTYYAPPARVLRAPPPRRVITPRVLYYQTRPLVITRPLQSYPTFSGSL